MVALTEVADLSSYVIRTFKVWQVRYVTIPLPSINIQKLPIKFSSTLSLLPLVILITDKTG